MTMSQLKKGISPLALVAIGAAGVIGSSWLYLGSDFFAALKRYDMGEIAEAGPAGCDSDKCLLPLSKPS